MSTTTGNWTEISGGGAVYKRNKVEQSLRDIQTIGWVAKRHFGAETLHGLVDHGFLTEPEHEELSDQKLFDSSGSVSTEQ